MRKRERIELLSVENTVRQAIMRLARPLLGHVAVG